MHLLESKPGRDGRPICGIPAGRSTALIGSGSAHGPPPRHTDVTRHDVGFVGNGRREPGTHRRPSGRLLCGLRGGIGRPRPIAMSSGPHSPRGNSGPDRCSARQRPPREGVGMRACATEWVVTPKSIFTAVPAPPPSRPVPPPRFGRLRTSSTGTREPRPLHASRHSRRARRCRSDPLSRACRVPDHARGLHHCRYPGFDPGPSTRASTHPQYPPLRSLRRVRTHPVHRFLDGLARVLRPRHGCHYDLRFVSGSVD